VFGEPEAGGGIAPAMIDDAVMDALGEVDRRRNRDMDERIEGFVDLLAATGGEIDFVFLSPSPAWDGGTDGGDSRCRPEVGVDGIVQPNSEETGMTLFDFKRHVELTQK